MSLPAQSIDWQRLERDVKGLRIGLLLDAGVGLPVEPEIARRGRGRGEALRGRRRERRAASRRS